jgi:CBS domain-containing protein
MTCHECSEKMTAYMEGELSAEAEAQVVAHVDSCTECRRTLESLRAVVGAVTSLPDVAPPPELRADISRAVTEHATQQRPRTLLRRTRYITSALAAAAAALVVIWAGTTHLSRQGTMEMRGELPASAPIVAERVADEVTAETEPTMAAAEEPAGEEAEVMLGAAPAEIADEVPMRSVRHETAPVIRDAAPVADLADDIAPAPPVPPQPTMTSEGDAGRPMMAAVAPGGRADETAPAVEGATGLSTMASRAAGPAGSVMEKMVAMAADEEEDLLRVEPKYFAADRGMVARMGPVGDTPFTVSVFPPTRRAVGEIVPATVTVETERDVQRARIQVRGLRTLEVVGVSEDGVIYRGALLANQKTEQTVRIRAHEPGTQSMLVNLRSSHPEVETDLVVEMGEFQIEVPPTLQNIEVAFEETPVSEAIEQIAETSGMQVQVAGELPDQRVTKDFSAGVPAEAALRIVAEDVGWQVRADEGLQIVEPLPATATDDG